MNIEKLRTLTCPYEGVQHFEQNSEPILYNMIVVGNVIHKSKVSHRDASVASEVHGLMFNPTLPAACV